MSFFRINGSLIKNLFGRKPADYEPAEGSDEIRGRITIDTESCTLCGKCEDHCIVGALYIDEQEETWKSIECSAFCVENVPRSVRRNVCICQVSRWNRNLQ